MLDTQGEIDGGRKNTEHVVVMAEWNKSSNLVCSLILSELDEWELDSGSLEKPHRSVRLGDSCHTLNYLPQTPILELEWTSLLFMQLEKPKGIHDRLTQEHRKYTQICDILLTCFATLLA